jgi:hypothetical protein
MNSALDAMVEELVKHWRRFRVERIADHVLAKRRGEAGDAIGSVDAATLAAVEDVVRREAERLVPAALKPRGSGIARYEKPLKRVGWGAPEDRPVPAELDVALTELGALRDVLVHRAGRGDDAALKQAPTLRYQAGQLVRISREDYRKVLRCDPLLRQGDRFRGIRGWPEVSDARDGPHLMQWRDYVIVNA